PTRAHARQVTRPGLAAAQAAVVARPHPEGRQHVQVLPHRPRTDRHHHGLEAQEPRPHPGARSRHGGLSSCSKSCQNTLEFRMEETIRMVTGCDVMIFAILGRGSLGASIIRSLEDANEGVRTASQDAERDLFREATGCRAVVYASTATLLHGT